VIEIGSDVYEGMVIGEPKQTPAICTSISPRKKHLTNMRASSSDATVTLRPPRRMSLDQSIEFIAEDELIEVTPQSIRLCKMELDKSKRHSKLNV